MSKIIFDIGYNRGFDMDKIVVSANSNDNYINIGIKDSTIDRIGWFELDVNSQLRLAHAIITNLQNRGAIIETITDVCD